MNDVTMMKTRQVELHQHQQQGYLRAFFGESQPVNVDKLRKNKESMNGAITRGSNKPMSTLQQNFEETFNKIKAATGITEVDELVRTFIKNEEHNFSLLNCVNEQNNETKKYEEQIQQLKEEELKFAEHKEILRDLESKLQTSESMAEKYEQRCQDLQHITESLKRGMQSIFSQFDFAEEEGVPPPVVTEVNMVHNLGLIDQKANQLLQRYSQVRGLLQGPPSTKASTQGRTPFGNNRNDRDRAAAAVAEEEHGFDELQDMSQNLVSVLGTGPNVPMDQELLHVNPPKSEDYRSIDSDNEDDGDTRPLTRDELKHRTLNKLQKLLGLGGMMAMLSLTGGGATGITNSSTLHNTSSSSAAHYGILVAFLVLILSVVSTFLCSGKKLLPKGKPLHSACSRTRWRAILIGLSLMLCKTSNGAPTLPQSEYLALYDLYNSTNGADWRWSNLPQAGIPWVFGADANPCADNWQGLNCILGEHVASLALQGMNLRGPIPSTLDNLPYLVFLEMSTNKLTGSIPNSIGNLANLQQLYLGINQLNGSIPSSIGNLTNLLYLYLHSNQLSGSIPITFGDLTNLLDVYLDGNQLTGSIPSSIGKLKKLQYLSLKYNHLTGSIPSSIGNLTNLQYLYLHFNRLTGSIPSSVGNLTNLLFLALYQNHLIGPIPSSIGILANLQELNLYSNQLTGSIPNSMGNLTNLLFLTLYRNQLTGSIPSSIGNLTNLQLLALDYNQLTGSIPSSIGTLKNLQQLALYLNQLTGSIPSSICNLMNLQYLYLYANQLTGSIPSSIGNLTNLQDLYLDSNQLTGSIPSSIGYIKNLQKVFLDFNEITGSFPSFFGESVNLTYWSIQSNRITGSIPSSLVYLTNLQFLDLSDNQLTGQLSLLGHMSSLVSISLQSNRFTGSLVDVFRISQIHLQAVQLDDNQFTGTLPAVLFDLPSLVSFSMVGSCLHGTLPGNICNATQLEALILYGLTTGASCRARGVQLQSRQAFAGTMPSCLLQLPNLVTLLLSSNGLSGSIASDIVLGSKLLQLDLSHNDLTGAIPNNLQNHSWSLLDLSHNKLSGTLHADLLRPLNATLLLNYSYFANPTVSLTSNRLSGPVPTSLRPLQSNLSVLAGNLFECKYDKSNLPQHDSDISNYQCASNDFNAAVFVWLSLCVGVTVLLLLVVYRHNLSFILKTALIQLPDEYSARLTHLHSLLEEYHVLSKAAWCCAAFCLVVLLPYYATVSHYEGTHTYQYAYVLSAIYISGVLSFVFDMLLLGLLIAVVYASYIVKYTMVTITTPSASSDQRLPDRWRYASVVIIYSLANIIVVLGANVAFVYVVLYQSSHVQTLAQVFLSLFKLGWSVAASPYLIRQLDMYFYPAEKGPAQSYFELQLLIALFNNIAIPCLVVAAIDPNCFSNILLPPDSENVAYLLPTCRNAAFFADSCLQTAPEQASLTFTPPFTYSYQCSASFITSYAPTFIYMSISTVFLNPLLQYILMWLHERLPTGSIAHRMVSKLLPRILKPDVSPSLDHHRRTPLLGAIGTLVTLLTQLGILLTFGAIFPPVALAMAVSITAVVVMIRCKVQRFVHVVVEKQLFSYLDIINAECERVGTREQMQVAAKILICYCCAFYTLFLFDTLGDAVGFDASVWVLVVFPLLPFAVYGAESLWWRGYKVVIKEVQRNEVNSEESLEPAATADIDIELSAARSSEFGMNLKGGPNRTAADLRKGESEDNCDKDHTVNILHANDV